MVSNQSVLVEFPIGVERERRMSTRSERSKLHRRALPPEGNSTLVCYQELTEYHELKHSHKMFFDNVGSRYVTLDNVRTVAILWQRVRVEWTWKFLESLPKLGNRPPQLQDNC